MALLSSFTAVQSYKGVLQMQITSRVVFYVLDSSRRSAITAELRSEHIPLLPWAQGSRTALVLRWKPPGTCAGPWSGTINGN